MGPGPQWRTLAAVSMLRLVLTMRLELKDGQMSNKSLVLDKYPGDDCSVEAQQTKQLLRDLGYEGTLDGDHCMWPGITCQMWPNPCAVKELHCETCSGQLPENISLKQLQEVLLTSPKLTGDIKVFKGLPDLRRLYLQGTQVHGDLHAFIGARHIDELHLGNTKVTGDLKDLQNFISPHDIDLSNTQVSGDLEMLRKFHYLETLNLRGTKLTGNLDVIPCFGIREVDLSYTQVVGRITDAWMGRCQHLHTLLLRNSSVQFANDGTVYMDGAGKEPMKMILPSLKNLDLTNCPVNSPAQNVLAPLVLSSVTYIQAANAGISGFLPNLKNSNVTFRITQDANFTFPLAQSLLMLDLTGNKLTAVDGLPVKTNIGRIILRHNRAEVNLIPRVLTEAERDQIMLDLSGNTVSNQEAVAKLLESKTVRTTDMYAKRDDAGGYACKDLIGTVKVTPSKFLPDQLCKCLPGWHGHGATCQICPANQFSDEMGLETCKICPQNSTAPEGSTKLAHCKCDFGNLHNGRCSCDKHHALQKGDCVLCSKLHLHCRGDGNLASTATPDVEHARLEQGAEEARRCLPPDVSQRCPGSHQCGLGYSGTLCSSCSEGFWAKQGKCKPCAKSRVTRIWLHVLLGVVALLLAAFLGYRIAFGRHVPQTATVGRQVKRLMLLQAPHLLQLVQLWIVLSRLQGPSRSSGTLPEMPYLAILQLTMEDFQELVALQCTFDAETVRMVAALTSPLIPLLLLLCCASLELCRAGLGVNIALKVLAFLFIGGAYSTAELLSCQLQDGDGEALGDFAFRTAFPELRCSDRNGLGFWFNTVGYGSALAYGVLIPLGLAGLMVQQYFFLHQARLFSAYAEGQAEHITLRLQPLEGKLPLEILPRRLLAAAAAHMAVHCHGRRQVRLHEDYITTSSTEEVPEIQPLSMVKAMAAMASAETARNIDVLKSRRLAKMLTERIMLDEAEDRLLIGSQSLLCKYTLSEDVWMFVVMKLFAVALVCCMSMPDAWKWAIAFSLGMAMLAGLCQPYMWPQVNQLQSLSCCCLALASLAFAYDVAWLARLALLAPLLLLLWQVRCPDCTEALAERLYQELQLELPKLLRGESHEVLVQQLRF